MLAVALDLLTGRYGATEYNDRGRAEWPPHPARLFSALVAAWADAEEPDASERAALQWLEGLGAPQLACSGADDVARRSVVTVYVPGNDPTALRSSVDARDAARVVAEQALAQAQDSGDAVALHRATRAIHTEQTAYRDALRRASRATGTESASMIAAALEMLPENRNRQPRSFPVVTPARPTIWFMWPAADPDESTRAALDGLLARVARIGHSSTLVSCRLAPECDQPVTLLPRPDGATVLRVPGAGLLDRLEREYARHHSSAPRLLPAAMTTYGSPAALREPEPVGVHSGDWIVLDLPRQLAVHLTRSLELARAVREALIEHTGPLETGLISGRFPGDQPRPHLAVVPLPSVGHRWADGTVRGVALMLPRGEPLEPLESVLRSWRRSGFEVRLENRDAPVTFDPPRVVPANEGWSESPMPLRRASWCRPSQRWVSVTPVALDRFVRDLHHPVRHDRADEQVREVVSRSCLHTGLPEPVEVVISPVGMITGVPRTGCGGRGAFPRFVAAGSGQPRQTVHVSVSFAQKVRGPVLLGAGRYLGYGLFLPIQDPGDDQ
ncbi:MAG TPA: type I-U CRISPR-associated protein Csb2 [Pseudonocardiaceae bacterium]|nr:type I-U CRISPR-associated protein Csb2 [Pseudonocardiaceae bacterium]